MVMSSSGLYFRWLFCPPPIFSNNPVRGKGVVIVMSANFQCAMQVPALSNWKNSPASLTVPSRSSVDIFKELYYCPLMEGSIDLIDRYHHKKVSVNSSVYFLDHMILAASAQEDKHGPGQHSRRQP